MASNRGHTPCASTGSSTRARHAIRRPPTWTPTCGSVIRFRYQAGGASRRHGHAVPPISSVAAVHAVHRRGPRLAATAARSGQHQNIPGQEPGPAEATQQPQVQPTAQPYRSRVRPSGGHRAGDPLGQPTLLLGRATPPPSHPPDRHHTRHYRHTRRMRPVDPPRWDSGRISSGGVGFLAALGSSGVTPMNGWRRAITGHYLTGRGCVPRAVRKPRAHRPRRLPTPSPR